MNEEQKQRAIKLIAGWRGVFWRDAGNDMAALLQELIDAPEPEPVARVTGYYGGYLSIATVDGRVLPAGTALYAAPPHQSEQHLEMVLDAERYRWLKCERFDKPYAVTNENMIAVYEGEELDSAIDAAIAAEKGGA